MAIDKKPGDRVKLSRGSYTYIRRVPKRFSKVDNRVIVRISLSTSSITEAHQKASRVEADLEALWDSLLKGESNQAWIIYRAAVKRARLEGFEYSPASVLASGNVDKLLERLQILSGKEEDARLTTALAGGVDRPNISLSSALTKFFEYGQAELMGKRSNQVRHWQNQRKLAVKNFIAVIGEDKTISDISRTDAREFRGWWMKRISQQGMGRNSCNKQLSHLAKIIRVVCDENGMPDPRSFSGLMLSERKKPRPPFTREFVEKNMLAPGALAGLNNEAKCAMLACIETGMGPEEVASLLPAHIQLNCPVPHVAIVSRDGANQKTGYRPREIPLVGVSLAAMKMFPEGFDRYRGKAATLSNVINKFLRQNNLLPSPEYSLYSFRHSFQDRLIEVEAPERLQADIMGHKFHRERYGVGPSLQQKAGWLLKIIYETPGGEDSVI